MTGHNYPDHFYADALSKIRQHTTPTGAYRSTDPVTKPAHYQRAGIETIDYIRATLDRPGFEAYCIGNVLKYVSRYREKGGIEDLRKGQVYLGWAIGPVKPANPAAVREAKIAYDVACDKDDAGVCYAGIKFPDANARDAFMRGMQKQVEAFRCHPELQPKADMTERTPKWHVDYVKPRHPLNAETIRDHDERLVGGEDRL